MKFVSLAATAALALLGTAANATVLDFETLGDCSGGPDVTFTIVTNSSCTTLNQSPDDSSDYSLGLYAPDPDYVTPMVSQIRADFAVEQNRVSVALGDWRDDADQVFLAIYDSLDNLLGYSEFLRPETSAEMNVLALSSPNIAYAIFGSNDYDLGYIVVDDFAYAVPLPASALLLLSGLGGLAALRRKRAT